MAVKVYSAWRKKSAVLIAGYVALGFLLVWALRHIILVVGLHYGHHESLLVVYTLSFVFVLAQMSLYNFARPKRTTAADDRYLAHLRVIVNVPVCNEDPAALIDCLVSLLRQSRRPYLIHIVVNGPNNVDYSEVKKDVRRLRTATKTKIVWTTQAIAGKRHAHALTARRYLKPHNIFLTVDSDAYLDKEAIREGLKPLADQRVMSVAGLVLNSNNRSRPANPTD